MADLTFEARLAETFRRTVPKVGPEARRALAALVEPEALAITAGVLAAWVVSHAVGVGEVIDVIVGVVGTISVGLAIFEGLDHLYDFAIGAYRGRSPSDFDIAADHLAAAISILGIQAVLAVLFRGARAPKTWKGGRIELGPPPRIRAGLRYVPELVEDATQPAGQGWTTFWGDITVSTRGSDTDRALVVIHEKVHQFLAPKLDILRSYRASTRASSYMRSSLYRYIEEAMAETIAQVGVSGFRQFFAGVKFPVRKGYMYIRRGGGYSPHFKGHGLIPEGAALLYTGLAAGFAIEIYFSADGHSPRRR